MFSQLSSYIEAIMLAGKRKPFLLPTYAERRMAERSHPDVENPIPSPFRETDKVESVPTRCQVYEDVKQLVKQKWLRLFSSEVTIYPGEKYEPSDTSPFFQSD